MNKDIDRQFDLVIFDCDGVLVDSERITNTVFAEMLNEVGLTVTLDDMFRDFVGHSMTTCLRIVEERLGNPLPHDFVSELEARTGLALSGHLEPVSGINDVLGELSIPFCVASSGDHAKMLLTLGITGLLERFTDRLFSVTEVARGKPYPDVFLYAAERMDADASRTAVIEDSVVGVKAGVAAGMTVFGYAELTEPKKLMAAGAVVFNRMAQLPALLGLRKDSVAQYNIRSQATR